jgi:hypothetical protein
MKGDPSSPSVRLLNSPDTNMRTPLYLTALAASLIALATASTHQKPIQVYLYPAPSALESYQQTHEHAPVLSADQAQAVFSHHLGALGAQGGVDEYEKLPEGHEGWVHLLGDAQRVSEANKGRVVIIQGDVQAQGE